VIKVRVHDFCFKKWSMHTLKITPIGKTVGSLDWFKSHGPLVGFAVRNS